MSIQMCQRCDAMIDTDYVEMCDDVCRDCCSEYEIELYDREQYHPFLHRKLNKAKTMSDLDSITQIAREVGREQAFTDLMRLALTKDDTTKRVVFELVEELEQKKEAA